MKKVSAFILGFSVVLLSFFITSSKVSPLPQSISRIQKKSYPAKPNLTNTFPGYQDYKTIQQQLEEWKKESPGLTETGNYGTSTRGQKLSYIRVTNLLDETPKPKVLITACIHGNEPLACSTTMGFIGTMLSNYTVDSEVTELINTRDIYFVPVVCPDSYPNSRYCDGVDPNRNFPGLNSVQKSIKPLDDLQTWFLKIKFNAAISGHTYGRVILIPPGNSNTNTPDHQVFVDLYSEMSKLANYRYERACEMYGHPIYGTEIDWYYSKGAVSCVVEMGTHQKIPSKQDIEIELSRVKPAFHYFIKNAPITNISTQSYLTSLKDSLKSPDVDIFFYSFLRNCMSGRESEILVENYF